MNVAAAFFYLFSGLMLASAFMVIAARNPVHSVLFLILAFVNASGLFILLGAEFLAMLLVVVYVGAVAVLFLFVVMMLDVDFAELRAGFIKNAPVGLFVGAVLFAELSRIGNNLNQITRAFNSGFDIDRGEVVRLVARAWQTMLRDEVTARYVTMAEAKVRPR